MQIQKLEQAKPLYNKVVSTWVPGEFPDNEIVQQLQTRVGNVKRTLIEKG